MRFSNDCSEGDALCSGLALLAGCLRPLTRRVAHHISLAVICCHNAATNAETAGTSAKHLTVGKIARYVRYLRNSATPYCLASPGLKYKVSTALFFCIILATNSPRPNDQRSHFSDMAAACDEPFLSPSNRERKYELHGCLSFRRHGTYQFTPCLSQGFQNASRKQLREG